MIVLAIVVAIICGLFFYFLNIQQDGKKREKERMEQEQLAEQLLDIEPMEDDAAADSDAVVAEADAKEGAVPIIPTAEVGSKGYDTYESRTYYFQYKYPAWFQVLTDADNFFLCISRWQRQYGNWLCRYRRIYHSGAYERISSTGGWSYRL